jgi:hypothetical protein
LHKDTRCVVDPFPKAELPTLAQLSLIASGGRKPETRKEETTNEHEFTRIYGVADRWGQTSVPLNTKTVAESVFIRAY